MTWIPIPRVPLVCAKMCIVTGYHACPETGEIRNPVGQILTARRPGGAGGCSVRVMAEGGGVRRRKTCTTSGRLVALAMLKAGLVVRPNETTHHHRVTVVDKRALPRWSNLAWQGRWNGARAPLVLTPTGHDLLGPEEPR